MTATVNNLYLPVHEIGHFFSGTRSVQRQLDANYQQAATLSCRNMSEQSSEHSVPSQKIALNRLRTARFIMLPSECPRRAEGDAWIEVKYDNLRSGQRSNPCRCRTRIDACTLRRCATTFRRLGKCDQHALSSVKLDFHRNGLLPTIWPDPNNPV